MKRIAVELGRGSFNVLGSFGLAVTLLAFLFLLTWFGTLEQVELGLYLTQKKFFESWWVVHHIGPVPLLLPGGMAVMIVFALNLVVGGMIRIRKTRRNFGVLVAHVGMALLMLAGAVKQIDSEDGLMKLRPDEESSVFQSATRYEVVVWDATDTSDGVTEHRIPPSDIDDLVGRRTRKFESDVLPFDVVLGDYVRNARVVPAAGIGVPDHEVVGGWTVREVSAEKVDDVTIPAVYATVLTPDGQRKQSILFGVQRAPWTFELGGRTYAVSMRREVYDLPFVLRLDEFRRDMHPGTGMARAFESDITRIKEGEPERQVLVEMNRPLREDGYVVYQAQWGTDPDGVDFTKLQIVRNPSDQWPKYACYVIGAGLLMAFGTRLFAYLRQEQRRRSKESAA